MKQLINIYPRLRAFIFFTIIRIKRYIRVFLGKPIYYVIGDSHTLCFQSDYFEIFHVGPATAYKLNFKNSTTKGREKTINVLDKLYKNKKIYAIFVFGEIDARIHVNKFANEKKISIKEVIHNTAKSYLSFLNFVHRKYPLININVFNILPPGEEENIYNYAFYANRKKRQTIIKKLNKTLKDYSGKLGFNFIQVYEGLIDIKGDRKKEFIFDNAHYNRKIMPFVVEQLELLDGNKNSNVPEKVWIILYIGFTVLVLFIYIFVLLCRGGICLK